MDGFLFIFLHVEFYLFLFYIQPGNTIMQPLLSEEKVSTLKRLKPKPVVLPVDSFDSIYNDSKFLFLSYKYFFFFL